MQPKYEIILRPKTTPEPRVLECDGPSGDPIINYTPRANLGVLSFEEWMALPDHDREPRYTNPSNIKSDPDPEHVTLSLTANRSRPVMDALAERSRQDEKWGQQNHDPITWSAILTEECGEFAEAALHHRFGGPAACGLRNEAVQVAAVALQIVECLDRKGIN